MCVVLGVTRTGIEYISVASLILFSFYSFDHVDAQDLQLCKNYSDIRDASVARKTCLLKPDTGPCRANIVMYFFDPTKGKCNKFKWGGCQGNGNRFDSKEECYKSCYKNGTDNQKVRPRYCSLSFDYGYCFGAIPRYYYDPLWKVCKERIYSGCGGNKNNFYNIEQCDSVCRFGNGVLQHHKKRKGKLREVLIINPANSTKVDKNKQVSANNNMQWSDQVKNKQKNKNKSDKPPKIKVNVKYPTDEGHFHTTPIINIGYPNDEGHFFNNAIVNINGKKIDNYYNTNG